MVKSIPQTITAPAGKEETEMLKVVDISQLQSGENPGLMISARIVN